MESRSTNIFAANWAAMKRRGPSSASCATTRWIPGYWRPRSPPCSRTGICRGATRDLVRLARRPFLGTERIRGGGDDQRVDAGQAGDPCLPTLASWPRPSSIHLSRSIFCRQRSVWRTDLTRGCTPFLADSWGRGLLAHYLLGGDPAAEECLLLLRGTLPAPWQELTSAAVQIYRDIGARLPVAEAALAVSQDSKHLSDRARWSLVAQETEKLLALRNRFGFKSGTVMYQRITADDGILTRLHRAAMTDDPVLHRAVVGELPKKVRSYLDALVAEAGQEPIAWSKHRSFLEKVDDVFRMGRAAAESEALRTADSTAVRPADVEFVRWLRERWGELNTHAAGLPAPYHHPPLALLDRLRPLLAWRETQA